MNKKEIEGLLSDDAFKTAEERDAAARIAARGFASEMTRLAELFQLDKIAESEGESGLPAGEELPKEEGEAEGDELLALLEELGGL